MKFNLELGGFKISVGRDALKPIPPRKRSFPGAQMNRLTNDWQSPSSSADAELQGARRNLIYRCRQLERSNDYVRRYFKLVENNVLGSCGIGLQMKAKDRVGNFDKLDNGAIEKAWKDWGCREYASISRRLNWKRIEKLVLRSCIRDGGVLLRKIIEPLELNPYGFTLQPLEIDHLDNDMNRLEPNGNEIRMGVEFLPNGRVVQYHLFASHPGDNNQRRLRRIIVPANEMMHIYLPERIGQTVGFPSLVSSMLRLNMLGGYEEAELTAAREGACKGGYITNEKPENYVGDDVDELGNQIHEMEPGVIRELPPGQSFVEHDPKHPNTAYPSFTKSVLRGLAAGLGVSYTSLANDLEGVNYSSIRAGLLEEREEWKGLQDWIIDELHDPVFQDWLELSLTAGAIRLPNTAATPLPLSRLAKYQDYEWKPRRWPWVDPLKDMQANVLAVEKGFDSRRHLIAEEGRDIEDVYQEQSEDEKLAESYGLDFPTDVPAVVDTTPPTE